MLSIPVSQRIGLNPYLLITKTKFQSLSMIPTFTHCSSKFFLPPSPCSSFKPKIPPPTIAASAKKIPTDQVIDFGKYKGKMLGTLPSTYLKWVSKNLRAGDFQHWAQLADQVLQHPVYRDRLEWEFADSVLNGNGSINSSTKQQQQNRGGENSVSQLLAISERFGWDNEDKIGWRQIDFELLGTTKTARIPRLSSSSSSSTTGIVKEHREQGMGTSTDQVLSDSEERRRGRRERMRSKKAMVMEEEKLRKIVQKSGGSSGNGLIDGVDDDDDVEEDLRNNNNPFPGREALLKKVLLNRNRFQL